MTIPPHPDPTLPSRAASAPAIGQDPTASPLGKPSAYITHYDASLLFPIARQTKRDELGLSGTLPFFGIDIWNAYEVSWLNLRGKPQIAIATIMVPADSPNIVESKSFKLYLNAFNQTRLAGSDALLDLLRTDLSSALGSPVQVSLTLPDGFERLRMGELEGMSLDRLDIEVTDYQPDATLLYANHDEPPVDETLVSHLLKSNCLVTGQPDWGSVQIRYVGAPINQEGLLKYATETAIEYAREALRIEQEKQRYGRGIIENMLDAQAALFTSQARYYRALADYVTAAAAVRRETGI